MSGGARPARTNCGRIGEPGRGVRSGACDRRMGVSVMVGRVRWLPRSVHRYALVIGNAKYPIAPLKNPRQRRTRARQEAGGPRLRGAGPRSTSAAEQCRRDVGEFCRARVGSDGKGRAHAGGAVLCRPRRAGRRRELPAADRRPGPHQARSEAQRGRARYRCSRRWARARAPRRAARLLPRQSAAAHARRHAVARHLAGARQRAGAPKGVYVAFSTQPHFVALDGTGNNSPFTEGLLRVTSTIPASTCRKC